MSNLLNKMACMIYPILQMKYVHDIKTGEIETENKDTKKAKNDDGKTPLVPKNLPPPPPTEQPFKLATPCVFLSSFCLKGDYKEGIRLKEENKKKTQMLQSKEESN
eukprot:GHVP01057136.1.p1 GENE.GHVP01057136.1~~GHVP01057136.1.p1  ORF type:complete len:106 (+),score=22.97 GHVP01057136.1:363-680(+)